MLRNADPVPDVVRVEVAGVCNFRCVHCPVRPATNRGLLKPLDYQDIWSQLQFVPRVMVFYHGGEPLLNEWLPMFIKNAKERGVQKTVTNTNASRLTERKGLELIQAGLDEIKISFDGNSPEENDQIRRGGRYERDVQNAHKFLQHIHNGHPRVIIANTRFIKPHEIPDDRNYSLDPAEYLQKEFADEQVDFYAWPARQWPGMSVNGYEVLTYPHRPGRCAMMEETVTILANGDVVPCCEDLTGLAVMGNILKNTLPEIWYSAKYRDFRDNWRAGNYPPLCQNCYVVKRSYLIQEADL